MQSDQSPPVQNTASTAQAPASVQGTAQQRAVTAAKDLVLRYQESPFALSHELDRLKASYLEAEFNITTKTAEK